MDQKRNWSCNKSPSMVHVGTRMRLLASPDDCGRFLSMTVLCGRVRSFSTPCTTRSVDKFFRAQLCCSSSLSHIGSDLYSVSVQPLAKHLAHYLVRDLLILRPGMCESRPIPIAWSASFSQETLTSFSNGWRLAGKHFVRQLISH